MKKVQKHHKSNKKRQLKLSRSKSTSDLFLIIILKRKNHQSKNYLHINQL